jgi:hypothetical protein
MCSSLFELCIPRLFYVSTTQVLSTLHNYLVCKNFYNLFEEEFVQLRYMESSVEKRLHESFPKIFVEVG